MIFIFSIIKEEPEKEILEEFEKYSCIKQIIKWSFRKNGRKGVSNLYRQDDHYEIILNNEKLTLDLLNGEKDFTKNDMYLLSNGNYINLRFTSIKE